MRPVTGKLHMCLLVWFIKRGDSLSKKRYSQCAADGNDLGHWQHTFKVSWILYTSVDFIRSLDTSSWLCFLNFINIIICCSNSRSRLWYFLAWINLYLVVSMLLKTGNRPGIIPNQFIKPVQGCYRTNPYVCTSYARNNHRCFRYGGIRSGISIGLSWIRSAAEICHQHNQRNTPISTNILTINP